MLEEIDLHLTNKCDNHCVFCSFDSGKPKQNELSTAEIFDIIDQAQEMGVEDIHLTGGEPTLRDDLFDILEYAQRHYKGQMRMISNGNNLTYEYLTHLKECGITSLMLSLDGDAETHDRLRRHSGSYNHVIKAASTALELGFTVRFSLVANMLNLHTVKGEIVKAADMGVQYFSIFLMSPVGRAKNLSDILIPDVKWVQFCDELRSWYKEQEFSSCLNLIVEKGFEHKDTYVDVEHMKGRGSGCTRIGSNRAYIMIGSAGDVYPCVCFFNSEHVIANTRDYRLRDIIEKDELWSFYTGIEKIVYDECQGCDKADFCSSGCKGLREQGFSHQCGAEYYQVCPLMKESYQNDRLGGSSEEVM